MIKFKKFMSVMCAASVVASMAVMPAFAETASAYDYEVKYTDNCSTAMPKLTHPYGNGPISLNTDYGFAHVNSSFQTSADHYVMFDYGVKGNMELTFDYFADDIDYTANETFFTTNKEGETVSLGSEFRTRVFLKADDGTLKEVFHVGGENSGYSGKLAKDDGTELEIGTYARASRKYAVASKGEETAPTVGEDPSYVNVKVLIEDGKVSVYRKWNTEQNWKSLYSSRNLSAWDENKAPVFAFGGMKYVGMDDITVKTPAWGLVMEDDCTTNANFVHKYDKQWGKLYISSNSNGFVYMNKNTATNSEHYMMFDYGVKGNVEYQFDMFINDIDFDITNALTEDQEFRTRIFLTGEGKTITAKHTANGNSWKSSLKKDDPEAEALNLGTYARASRKYGAAAYGQETAPVVGANEPTHINVKVVVEDGKVTTYRKWNTENEWVDMEGSVSLNTWEPEKYATNFVMGGMRYLSVANVVVKAPVYDASLLPGVNPGSMKAVNAKLDFRGKYQADGTWTDYNADGGTLGDHIVVKDVITDDFIMSFNIKPSRFEWGKDLSIMFGTDVDTFTSGNSQTISNVVSGYGSNDRYTGRIGIGARGENGNAADLIEGYFANHIPEEPTAKRYGDVYKTLGSYVNLQETYNVMVSFVDGNLKFGIKKADGSDSWHYISKDYNEIPKVGHLVIWSNGAFSTGAHEMMNTFKLWVPEKSVAMNPTIAQGEDGAITTSAKIADYTGSEEYVQPKLLTALYKTTADGNKKLCGVNVSEDSVETSTVKTLTGSLTAPTAEGSYEVKAMLWDSINGLSPLTKATTDTITVAATEAE